MIVLSKIHMEFLSTKKQSAVLDFLAHHLVSQDEENYDLPYEDSIFIKGETWQMFVDGASNHSSITKRVACTNLSKLDFWVTNNAVEYKACIVGTRTT